MYPLTIVWPEGWEWHHTGQSMYLQMILGIYVTLGVFLLLDHRRRERCENLGRSRQRWNGTPPVSLSLSHYYTSIWAAKSQIESHTQHSWGQIEHPRDFLKLARHRDAGLQFKADFPAYEYMAYLRHHGFPSPLLDWTKSPFVAAFFAFREAAGDGDRVAIFAYRETAGAGKVGFAGEPGIIVQESRILTHRRHFLQQCKYTICTALKDPGPEWHYTSHHDVFKDPGTSGGLMFGLQDQLWKFTLPRSERRKFLAYLDEHNLNAYSLFGSEEAQMEMMARRELL